MLMLGSHKVILYCAISNIKVKNAIYLPSQFPVNITDTQHKSVILLLGQYYKRRYIT